MYLFTVELLRSGNEAYQDSYLVVFSFVCVCVYISQVREALIACHRPKHLVLLFVHF